MKLFLKTCALVSVLAATMVSCDSYKDNETPDTFIEADKQLSGVWQLSTVTRNSVDITKTMDFSQFKLHLNENGTYNLENRLPFPVKHDGMWTVDDPTHPFILTFTEADAIGGVEVGIQYPIVKGVRQLSITLNPGCGSNRYEYQFIKVNN